MDAVRLLLCVNDGRNGMPTGRCDALEVPDVLSLHAPLDGGPPCLISGRGVRMRFLGRTWPIRAHRPWVGNWCWDEVGVAPEVAVEILHRIRKSDLWSLEEAEVGVYGKWKRGERILAEDLVEAPA